MAGKKIFFWATTPGLIITLPAQSGQCRCSAWAAALLLAEHSAGEVAEECRLQVAQIPRAEKLGSRVVVAVDILELTSVGGKTWLRWWRVLDPLEMLRPRVGACLGLPSAWPGPLWTSRSSRRLARCSTVM
jgi:hypothetical protein